VSPAVRAAAAGRPDPAAARRAAGVRAAPWLTAGRAALADLSLDVAAAHRRWVRTLEQIAAVRGGRRRALRPPARLSLARLAALAAERVQEHHAHRRAPASRSLRNRLARLASGPAATLPAAVRASLALQLARIHRRRGEAERAQAWERRAGCVATYRVSPRYGRWPRLGLTRAYPPERQQRQQRLRGKRRRALGCRLTLRSADGHAGVRYVEATVDRERAGTATLQLAWQGPLVVWVNGEAALDPQKERAPRPAVRTLRVSLRAGKNRLRLKLPVSASVSRLAARWLPASAAASAAPARRSAATQPKARPRPRGAAAVGSSRLYAPLRWLLQIQRSLQRGLPDAGRAAAEKLAEAAPRFSWGHLLIGRLEQRDPLSPRDLRRNRARAAYRRGLEHHATAMRLRLHLASLLREQSKPKKALQLLERGPAASDGARRLRRLARIRLYQDLRWTPLATRAAQELARAHPRWRSAWRLAHRLAKDDHGAVHRVRAARRLRELDATDLAWARVLARQGRTAKALAELERVARLTTARRVAALEARWLERAGRPAEAERLLRERLARARWDPERRLRLANLLVAQGRKDVARELLRQGARAHPEQAALGRARLALGAPAPLERFRADGDAAIARYRKAGWAPGKRPVYVLDRTVIRVLESGARRVLTHQIVHLRSRKAVSQHGEVHLPDGARVLSLRTRKPDGSTREPEDPHGRERVSLPDLDVGDLIEVEYVTARPRSAAWPRGGFYGSRFSFRSVAAHFFYSELVVVTPPDLPLRTSRWGAVPAPAVKRRDGLRVTRYTARRQARLEPEPLAANLTGALPVVRVGARVSWGDFLRQRQELLWGLDTASHAVRERARRLCQGRSPAARARAVYDWVQQNIEQRGGLYVSASHTLASRAGSRIQLLRALLARCRVGPVRLRFLWPRHQEFSRAALPAFTAYRQPVVHLRLDGRPVHLVPQLQQAPFGYLPPLLNGSWAVTLERPDTPPRRIPVRREDEARHTRLQVRLQADGSAVVTGRDRLRGLVALKLRAAIRRVPERKLRQYLERAFFGRFFAGATLRRLSFEHQADPDQPLVMRYRLTVPRLARPARGGLVLPAGFFPSRIGRHYASLSSRELPLRLGPVGPHRLVADITLPAGLRLVGPPPARTLESRWGTFRLQVSATEDGARLQRKLSVPYRVVPPKRYRDFATWATAVDAAERPELRFQ
jgi:hypothetical protein